MRNRIRPGLRTAAEEKRGDEIVPEAAARIAHFLEEHNEDVAGGHQACKEVRMGGM